METIQKILKKPITATFIAIILDFCVAAGALAVAGYDPVAAFTALFQGIFSKPKYISNTIIKAAPIILTGISVAFAFKTGLFQHSVQRASTSPAPCARCWWAPSSTCPPPSRFPVVILAGVAGGALIGAITGFLKSRFGIP